MGDQMRMFRTRTAEDEEEAEEEEMEEMVMVPMMIGDADFAQTMKSKTPVQVRPIGLYRMQPSRNSS